MKPNDENNACIKADDYDKCMTPEVDMSILCDLPNSIFKDGSCEKCPDCTTAGYDRLKCHRSFEYESCMAKIAENMLVTPAPPASIAVPAAIPTPPASLVCASH